MGRLRNTRERFGTPEHVRIAAPLVLLRDPQQDVIGLVRIVLPRPERFRPPESLRRGEKSIDGDFGYAPNGWPIASSAIRVALVANFSWTIRLKSWS